MDYDNPKRKKWIDPDQPSTLTPKRNIYGECCAFDGIRKTCIMSCWNRIKHCWAL